MRNVVRRSLIGLLAAGGLVLAVAGPSSAQAAGQGAHNAVQATQAPVALAADWVWLNDYDTEVEAAPSARWP